MSAKTEKKVCFIISSEAHERAVAKISKSGTTISALAKLFVLRIAEEDSVEEFNLSENSERLRFSLSTEEKEAIAYHAQLNDWSMSRGRKSRWVMSSSLKRKAL